MDTLQKAFCFNWYCCAPPSNKLRVISFWSMWFALQQTRLQQGKAKLEACPVTLLQRLYFKIFTNPLCSKLCHLTNQSKASTIIEALGKQLSLNRTLMLHFLLGKISLRYSHSYSLIPFLAPICPRTNKPIMQGHHRQ